MEFKLYSKSLRQIEEKNYKGALKTTNQFLYLFPFSTKKIEVFWQRALVHTELNKVNEAIDDYSEAINFDTAFAESYRLRANLYYNHKNYNAALRDLNHAIRLDSNLATAYYSKAKIYQTQGTSELTCQFLELALKKGVIEAYTDIQEHCDSNSSTVRKYLLKELTQKSTDSDYGFSEYKPIKIGGKDIQRGETYLSLLRDKRGYPIPFRRLNTCCPYNSNNGAFGKALCETYEVIINEEKRFLYLSVYDYEEPKIPTGLYSTFHFQE
jgi:tetratricopeptide (TPR) repeat protein